MLGPMIITEGPILLDGTEVVMQAINSACRVVTGGEPPWGIAFGKRLARPQEERPDYSRLAASISLRDLSDLCDKREPDTCVDLSRMLGTRSFHEGILTLESI